MIASTFPDLFEGYILQTVIDPDALPDDYSTQVIRTIFLPLTHT